MRDVRYLLPSQHDEYRGTQASFWLLVALNVLVTVRSLIHLLADDGGANSIAGLDVDGTQGDNLISIFSTWGLSQLLLALLTWTVIARYRLLVPLMLALNLFDWAGRLLITAWKPLAAADAAPGEVGNYIFTPLCAIALWFALPTRSDDEPAAISRSDQSTARRRAGASDAIPHRWSMAEPAVTRQT